MDRLSEERRFRLYYRTNYWGDPETASGDSSRLDRAGLPLRVLSTLLRAREDLTILDLGCGDLNWAQHLELPPGSRYLAADIVAELVQASRLRLGERQGWDFLVLDARTDPFPPCDILLLRDVTIHLDERENLQLATRCRSSSAGLIIATTYRQPQGMRVSFGPDNSFHPVDLESPSLLGPAQIFLPEDDADMRSDSGLKGLGVWLLDTRFNRDELLHLLAPIAHAQPSHDRPPSEPSPGHDDAVFVDGRGHPFVAAMPHESPSGPTVEMRPVLVSLDALDRRLTKMRGIVVPEAGRGLVLGRHAVVCASTGPVHARGPLYLLRQRADAKGVIDLTVPGLTGAHGYLRSRARVSPRRLLPLPADDVTPLTRYLLAYPLADVLSCETEILALESLGAPLTAEIWGAGTVGLLFTRLLRERGWRVVVADIFGSRTAPAHAATVAGATYVESDFDHLAVAPALLTVACSGDPASAAAAAACTDDRGTTITWPEWGSRTGAHTYPIGAGGRARPSCRQYVPHLPCDHLLERAVAMLSGPGGCWFDLLVNEPVPLTRYESALFPRIPHGVSPVEVRPKGSQRELAVSRSARSPSH